MTGKMSGTTRQSMCSCCRKCTFIYLFKHPLRVGNAGRLLPAAPGGEVVAGGQLIHGDHGAGGLLATQLQHGEQVQRHGAHVRQRSHLHIACSVLCHILKFLAIWKLYYKSRSSGIVHNVLYKWTVEPCGTVYCTYVCCEEVGKQTLFKSS